MKFAKPLVLPVGIGLMVGASMAILDLTLFRHALPDGLFRLIDSQTFTQRLATFMPLAVLDELIYRLLLLSAVVWISRRFIPAEIAWKLSIVGVALCYIPLHSAYVQSLGALTPMVVTREVVEHVGAGVAWGLLFWKRGLFASIAGHMSAQLPLQLGWAMLAYR